MDYEGRWYYFNKDGFPVTGPKTIDGFELYFHESSRPEGHQAKGEFINIDTTSTETMVVKSRIHLLS